MSLSAVWPWTSSVPPTGTWPLRHCLRLGNEEGRNPVFHCYEKEFKKNTFEGERWIFGSEVGGVKPQARGRTDSALSLGPPGPCVDSPGSGLSLSQCHPFFSPGRWAFLASLEPKHVCLCVPIQGFPLHTGEAQQHCPALWDQMDPAHI